MALGAVPGALLRWLLHLDPVANLLGCLVIGISTGLHPPRPRLVLLVAIGFCGALTTFSGWIAALATAFRLGAPATIAARLLELVAGVVLVRAGRALAQRRPGALSLHKSLSRIRR